MKKEYLILLRRMSIIKFYAIVINCISLSMMMAMESNAQKSLRDVEVNLEFEDQRLAQILGTIEKSTGFNFSYDESNLDLKYVVSIDEYSGQLYGLLLDISDKAVVKFKRVGENITVSPIKRNSSKEYKVLDLFPPIEITGKVVDETGTGMPGVNILVKDSNTGTVSEIDGTYRLEIPSDDVTLIFSYVGYKSQEADVNGRQVINIEMSPDLENLEELVVIGYGAVKESDLTGSVTTVKPDDFAKQITSNALQALSGKAAGVVVNQTTSEPGGEMNVRIRGAGSINSSNSVLIVIDGLPGGDPASISPSDIESIEILKDASAAAIYGTRGANGVILITTKNGNTEGANVSYSNYFALQTVGKKLDVLNAREYMEMRNYINNGLGMSDAFTPDEINSAGNGTYWQDELFRTAFAMNHQISIRGGTPNIKYYTSLGYLDQDGIMISSGLERYNTNIKLDFTPTNRLKFGVNLVGSVSFKDILANTHDNDFEFNDPLNIAIQFDPTIAPGLDSAGKYPINPFAALDNPVATAYGFDDKEQSYNVFGNFSAQYDITDELNASFQIGASTQNSRYDSYKDRTGHVGEALGGLGSINSSINNYYMLQALLNYDKSLGNSHHISATAGATQEKFVRSTQFSGASGFLSDVTSTNLLSSGNRETFLVNSGKSSNKLQSYFARVNYSFKDRYLVTATFRYDGSSRFSEENKFGSFPSLALGWRISEESFLARSNIIDNLKIRVGYGRLGNEGINNFETIQTFVAGGNAVLGGTVQSGAEPARIPNPNLKWETTEGINVGLDFGLYQSRISGELEYFIKNSIDQLFNQPVPLTTGFSNVRTNFGTVRNSGIELSLRTHNLVGKFQWTTSILFSTLKNEVIELPPFVGDIITTGQIGTFTNNYALIQEGYPIYAYYGYKIDGIFQLDDNIGESAQPNAEPGYPIFFDKNGDGTINANDRTVLGDPFPDITYSLTNSFSYNNFQLDISLMGMEGIESLNSNVIESLRPQNIYRNILSKHYYGRWTEDNPDAEFPSGINSPTYFNQGKEVNSYSVQDASFFRLQNVTLTYNFMLKDVVGLSVFVSGENLATITKLDSFDPDANQSGTNVSKTAYNNYPYPKVYRIGATINF